MLRSSGSEKEARWIGAVAAIGLAALACAGVPRCVAQAQAQPEAGAPSSLLAESVVPRLVRYPGVAPNRAGDRVEATFRVYAAQRGGEPLWQETQLIQVEPDGKFSVLLGIATQGGLPQSLFSAGVGQWLAVSIERAEEQPRVQLAAAAYAMKAADAETLAGVPATSFVTQSQLAAAAAALTAQAAQRILPETTPSGSGAANYLAYWTGAATLGDSAIYQAGTAAAPLLGIGTASPVTTLDVKGAATVRGTLNVPPLTAATTAAAVNSPMLEIGASIFDSTTSAAVTDTYAWQAVSLGNNTTAPRANLNLYYIAGTAAPVPTGFSVNSIGEVTFGATQRFPYTINHVFAGNGLLGGGSGGPIGSGVTLSVDTSKVMTGVSAGPGLVGGGTGGAQTLSLDTTMVPLLAASNTFTGYQTINNNEYVSGTATVAGTLTAGTTSSPAYSSPNNDGVNALTDNGAAVWGYSYHGYGGIFETTNTAKIQSGPDYFMPAVFATNYGSGGALEARNSGYGTAAFIYSDYWSNLSQNQIKNYNAALWADSGAMNGIIGSSDGYNGGAFFNNSSGYATILARNFGSGGTGAIAPPLKDFGAVIRAEGASGVCGISTAGEVSCTGGVKVLANTQGASHLVETYSVQSAESWMEDFGSGSLENGRASIPIDPTFADAANTAVEYHVFLTPDGDCKGLYIANKTATGFEVHELGGGSSSIAFEYRIVAKRKGHEGERLTDVTERFNREKEAASHAPTPPVEASTPKRPGTPWATQRAPTGQERK